MNRLRKNIGKQFDLQYPQKISRNKLNKKVKELYNKNYKSLKKKIKDIYRRWKDLPGSWIGTINIVKMDILPKSIYMFNVIRIKISMMFITEIEKSTLKFIWKHERLQVAKPILSKRSNSGGITILDFKLYYRAIAIKQHGTGTKTDMKTSGIE
jgi:hypothetical protein